MQIRAKNDSTVRNRRAILVTSHPGQPSCGELERRAAAGEQPRKDYVELARVLDADVIDSHYMLQRATPVAQVIVRLAGLPAGQVAEAFLRQRRYRSIFAWADRLGLPLALLFKLARSRRDLVMVSAWSSRPKKAVFLKHVKVHSHLQLIAFESSVQLEIAASHLGVPRQKLHLTPTPSAVDDRFWCPQPEPIENMICSVGWTARDYPTLIEAVQELDLKVELAVGSSVPTPARTRELVGAAIPPNVLLRHGLTFRELRRLYARSRFVVVPLADVEFNAGVTAVLEAMMMSKAVIVTRTRGQVDLIRDGEHGIYVPPGDSTALRAAIEYLVSRPTEAYRMGRAGRVLAEERHTLDACVSRLAVLARGIDESAVSPRAPHADTPGRSSGPEGRPVRAQMPEIVGADG